MRLYTIRHLTRYQYHHPVTNSYNLLCLQPRSNERQQLRQFELQINPAASSVHQQLDWFGNQKHLLHLAQRHLELEVVAQSEIMLQSAPVLPEPQWSWNQLISASTQQKLPLLAQYCLLPSPLIPADAAYHSFIQPLLQDGLSVAAQAQQLTTAIYQQFSYDPEFSSVITPPTEVLAHKKGVCQDFAQLAIACLRSVGLAARYVSGYLETEPPAGQPRLMGADASHAWFEVFCPEQGWLGFDPTNNCRAEEQHLVLAYGRDYSDVVPLKGLVQGHGDHQLHVAVDVIRQPDCPTVPD